MIDNELSLSSFQLLISRGLLNVGRSGKIDDELLLSQAVVI